MRAVTTSQSHLKPVRINPAGRERDNIGQVGILRRGRMRESIQAIPIIASGYEP